jgi:prephenate dehydrogenase
VFNRIVIVGAGLLGGSLGLDLRRRSLAQRITAVTRTEETARAILERGAADEVFTDLSPLADADLVVLGAPVQAIIDSLPSIAQHTGADTIVTDVGSTKSAIVSAGETVLGRRFVGGHPMAGSHHAGVEAAREGLFEGATWVFTPTRTTDSQALDRLTALVRALGAVPEVMDVETHDRIAAAVSHMPHVAACAVSLAVGTLSGGDTRYGKLAGGGLRDMTRLAASPAYLWRDILSTNRGNAKEAVTLLRQALQQSLDALDDDDAIERLFGEAAAARSVLIRDP